MMSNERIVTIIGQYRYTIYNTGYSSARFGVCEVCGKHVSEVWSQREERQYEPDQEELDWFKEHDITPDGFYTTYNCTWYLGHRECLESKQRNPATAEPPTPARPEPIPEEAKKELQ